MFISLVLPRFADSHPPFSPALQGGRKIASPDCQDVASHPHQRLDPGWRGWIKRRDVLSEPMKILFNWHQGQVVNVKKTGPVSIIQVMTPGLLEPLNEDLNNTLTS